MYKRIDMIDGANSDEYSRRKSSHQPTKLNKQELLENLNSNRECLGAL